MMVFISSIPFELNMALSFLMWLGMFIITPLTLFTISIEIYRRYLWDGNKRSHSNPISFFFMVYRKYKYFSFEKAFNYEEEMEK